MDDHSANTDPLATRELGNDIASASNGDALETTPFGQSDSRPNSGHLVVRCPNCHAPTDVAADSAFTELVCSSCGSNFSLVDTNATSRQPAPRMGRFEPIAEVGFGAFGSVWKARDKQLDRTVAVKIPRQSAMDAAEQEQFFREARTVAQLRHPNIVSVHEVGRDGDSIYIVSDFVQGVTLSDWLTGQQLTSREAAELCAKIATALHHAHEQGVIHRDLKPANIMIDPAGEPHLMDFGMARREVGEITITADGQFKGTPAYMSPEQAKGAAHAADRRSDVYSLGVILYELLTGEFPFRGSFQMLVHQVIHDEPPSPRKLNASVPKDMETITLKCLEKEPAKRYATASELAEELRRYLSGHPIHARPIGQPARAWRWAKRRPATAAFLALLVASTIGSAAAFVYERTLRSEIEMQTNEARTQRDNAQAVVDFLTHDVLAKASPLETQDKQLSDMLAQKVLEPAAAKVGERFKEKPLIEAEIRNTLAYVLSPLGYYDRALEQEKLALELRQRELGPEHPDTLTSLNNYAYSLQANRRPQEAEPLLKEVWNRRATKLGPEHPDTLRSQNNYAGVLEALNRAPEAEPLYKQALDMRRRLFGEEDPDTITSLNNYAGVLQRLGRPQEAEPLFKKALAQRRKVLGDDHPDTFTLQKNYAEVLWKLDRLKEAESEMKQSLEKHRQRLGNEHPSTMRTIADYSYLLHALNRTAEAEPLLKEALELRRERSGSNHPITMTLLNDYAFVIYSLGRAKESEPLFREAYERRRKALGENDPATIQTRNSLTAVQKELGHTDENDAQHEPDEQNSDQKTKHTENK